MSWMISMLVFAALPTVSPGAVSADAHVYEIAAELGAYDAEFSREAAITVGEATFQLHGTRGIMRVRVVIANAPAVDPSDSIERERGQELLEALNRAPAKYETAGGFFVWDRATESYQLCRDFRLTAREPDFQAQIDELLEVAHEWRVNWFSEISLDLQRQ